ncbi:MAG TPA: hypothetical protein VN915_14475 [Elusimicrobiota bacterium]|nr:hypothetical protein [Elusimicrobiota bacterium]
MSRWLALLAVLACAAAPRPAEYVLREGRFAVRPPAGWTAGRDAREDERQKVYGVRLSGPRGADGVLATISLAYYPSGNALFKGGAAEFLKRSLGADERFVPPAGESTSPVKDGELGGLPSKAFTRRSHEYLPPDRMDSKEVAVVEEVEVAPAKEGFYVLQFKASAEQAPKLKRAWSAVRKSIRFL